MIEISVTWAFIIFSFVILLVSAVLWYFSELNVRKIYNFYKEQYVWKCAYCAFVYLDADSEEISQCPRCSSYNVAYQEAGSAWRPEKGSGSNESMIKEIRRKNPSRRKNPHARHRGPRRRR